MGRDHAATTAIAAAAAAANRQHSTTNGGADIKRFMSVNFTARLFKIFEPLTSRAAVSMRCAAETLKHPQEPALFSPLLSSFVLLIQMQRSQVLRVFLLVGCRHPFVYLPSIAMSGVTFIFGPHPEAKCLFFFDLFFVSLFVFFFYNH